MDDFERYRRELTAHCYRMLGTPEDAEDLVQETYLRAWRARGDYDASRASFRTWLYRIATNACLTALRSRGRRPLPMDLAAPDEDPHGPLRPGEVPWLAPFPCDPAEEAAARGSMRLAFVASVQYLPARQRAVLLLRDVLDFPAAEVAVLLETSVAAVNSALQRARARVGRLAEHDVDATAAREVVDRYVAAFEAADVEGLSRLLARDAILEMPPVLNWLIGRAHYASFIERVYGMAGTEWRMLPVWANGQPGVAAYAAGVAHSLQVFDVRDARVARNTVWVVPELFGRFGLPERL
ncbi:RNA polymerase sigma factor [Actinorhabdospora filicis]|uniref:RNA polymerase sigma factor n=1 Tax=Actinorhabdospora filicis TaxID=1785913 RepID=A0A9W6SSJ3_9ACTN|nr:RNA polymerase sigma factor [Actinorhabdospora filicis]